MLRYLFSDLTPVELHQGEDADSSASGLSRIYMDESSLSLSRPVAVTYHCQEVKI